MSILNTYVRGGITAVFLVVAALAQQPPAQSQPGVPDPARFQNDIRAFAKWDRKNSVPTGALLFVGSSSIVGWGTHEAFPEWPVLNRGFGGSHMSDLNHYFDQVVKPYAARAIVVYEGDNDIADDRTPEQVCGEYRVFVRKVRTIQPDVPIVILSIKPSRARWERWPAMQQANALLRHLSDEEKSVTFVDVGAPLLGSDGQPRTELFQADKLHLNADGYALWNKTLRPILERAMSRS
ncbi:MAG: GDSL-type esterase/lipase family protein [Phycisphaerae bacterium]